MREERARLEGGEGGSQFKLIDVRVRVLPRVRYHHIPPQAALIFVATATDDELMLQSDLQEEDSAEQITMDLLASTELSSARLSKCNSVRFESQKSGVLCSQRMGLPARRRGAARDRGRAGRGVAR